MIDFLLDRQRVLGATTGMASAARKRFTRTVLAGPRTWLGALLLSRSIAAEQASTSERTPVGDQKSFIPRDPVMSFFQAAHEQRLEETKTAALADHVEPRPPASGYPTDWTATGAAFSEGFNWSTGFDYHWITEFLGELTTHFLRRVTFRLPSGDPNKYRMAPDARVILVGDWGTGEGVALAVADQIRREIDAAGRREVHVVHLGDVYYAGTEWEARRRFLDHWPVAVEEGDRIRSWCLNGNHDMYSGGGGLFTTILGDRRFSLQRTDLGRPTSEFHLFNDSWTVHGLDTSWRFRLSDIRGGAGYLARRQRRRLARQQQTTARTLLLTHHQPFTRVRAGADGIDTLGNLLAATAPIREGAGVDAWFWGHEHRLFTYGARAGIGYGTCMGHGAVLEVPAVGDVAGAGEAEYLDTFTDEDDDRWRMPGFAVLDFADRSLTVRYLDMHGHLWRDPDIL